MAEEMVFNCPPIGLVRCQGSWGERWARAKELQRSLAMSEMTFSDEMELMAQEENRKREKKWGAKWLALKAEREASKLAEEAGREARKLAEEVEREEKEERRRQEAAEAQRRDLKLANEIAGMLEPLDIQNRLYVLKVVVAMANTTVNLKVSLEIG